MSKDIDKVYTSKDKVPTYFGNINLKARDVKMVLTAEEENELIKCALDPVYFIEKYVKIVHIDHGLVPMKLYPYQRKIVSKYVNSKKMAINQSRQSGKCLSFDTLVKVRNKKTGKIEEITIGELYVRQKSKR